MKDAPFSRSAIDRHMTPVGLCNVFYDGKAKTRAAMIPAPGFIHPIKSFKKS